MTECKKLGVSIRVSKHLRRYLPEIANSDLDLIVSEESAGKDSKWVVPGCWMLPVPKL